MSDDVFAVFRIGRQCAGEEVELLLEVGGDTRKNHDVAKHHDREALAHQLGASRDIRHAKRGFGDAVSHVGPDGGRDGGMTGKRHTECPRDALKGDVVVCGSHAPAGEDMGDAGGKLADRVRDHADVVGDHRDPHQVDPNRPQSLCQPRAVLVGKLAG